MVSEREQTASSSNSGDKGRVIYSFSTRSDRPDGHKNFFRKLVNHIIPDRGTLYFRSTLGFSMVKTTKGNRIRLLFHTDALGRRHRQVTGFGFGANSYKPIAGNIYQPGNSLSVGSSRVLDRQRGYPPLFISGSRAKPNYLLRWLVKGSYRRYRTNERGNENSISI